MGNALNSISLAIGLLGSAHPSGSGPADWADYVWKESGYMRCLSKDGAGFCRTFHGRWDWKRDQWVDLAYQSDAAKRTITIQLKLDNKDRADNDYVCVTALFLNRKGADVAVYHANTYSQARKVTGRTDTLRIAGQSLAAIEKVVVGTKQCRDGAHQDDGVFVAAKKQIGQK